MPSLNFNFPISFDMIDKFREQVEPEIWETRLQQMAELDASGQSDI